MDAANLNQNGHKDTHHSSQTARALAESARAQLVNQNTHIRAHQTLEDARHQHAAAKDGIDDGQPIDIASVGKAHRTIVQKLENSGNFSILQQLDAKQSRAMVSSRVLSTKLMGHTCLIIVIIPNGHHVYHAEHQGNEKYRPQETLLVLVLPTGIKNGGQEEEKQYLAYAPQHPTQLKGMLAKE